MINPSANENEIKAFLAGRKEAGRRIDLNNVEVTWCYAQTFDPYGREGVPPELDQVGREEFARSPDSDGWVWFGDLPDATREDLWRKMRCGELPNERVETFLKLWYMIRAGLTLAEREDFRARLEALLKELNSTQALML
jgi:hypothetical protein